MEKREKLSKTITVVFTVFLIWSLLNIIAPVVLPNGSVQDLNGYAGTADNEEAFENMAVPWNFVYGCGDRLCHQKAERSFFLNENQMPFCGRCTAIWFGLVIGLGIMLFYRIELDEKFLLLMFLGIIPIGIDGIGQLLEFWESTNLMRVLTGLLTGIICGVAIALIIDEIKSFGNYNEKNKN